MRGARAGRQMNRESEQPAAIVDGTQLFLMDDDGILFSPARQTLHALNTAAAYLWCLLEDGTGEAAMLRAYRDTFRVAEDTAAGHVGSMLDHFHDQGLITRPGRPLPPPPAPKPRREDLPERALDGARVEASVAQWAIESRYRLLNTEFRLRFSDPAQSDWVHPVLQNFAIPAGASAHNNSELIIDIVDENGALRVYRDGRLEGECDGLDALAPLVKGSLWTTAVNRSDYFLNIHAGVLASAEGCVLLPAAAGSGKSSLTAAMVHAGFPYLSDEVALMGEDCTVTSLPLAMCFKNTGWHVVSGLFDAVDRLPAHRRSDGKVVKYLALPRRYWADPAQAHAVRAIIFPRYRAHAPNQMSAVPRVQALDQLFTECVSIPGDLTGARVARLVAWIKGVECFALDFSDLAAATKAISQHLAPG